MNKLLLDEQPILILPQLAKVIGLNESIVLQQVHYWIKHNESQNRNNKEGFHWVYNTFEEWEKQFPFWSGRTIKRTFKKLEDEKLLIVGNYNKKTYDRTKWYRINYKNLENLATDHSDKVAQCTMSKWHNGMGQFDTMDDDKMAQPIPKTNSETNPEINYIYMLFELWNSKVIIKHRKLTDVMKRNTNARLSEYSFEELSKAIENYKFVLDSNNHYWTHKWTFDAFMKPSNVTRFVDEADPLNNFKKNTNSSGQAAFVPMEER